MSVQTCSIWARQSSFEPEKPACRQPPGSGIVSSQIEYCPSSFTTTRYVSARSLIGADPFPSVCSLFAGVLDDPPALDDEDDAARVLEQLGLGQRVEVHRD